MEFRISGTRVTTTVTTVVEKIEEGCLEMGKSKVLKITGCPSSEDGDPSVWYEYVEEALLMGAKHRLDDCTGKTTVLSEETETTTDWQHLDVDYG